MRLYHYLRKRGLALFMALVMCLSLLPAEAMAGEQLAGPEGRRVSVQVEYPSFNRDTAEITYTVEPQLSNVHLICLVDKTGANPAAAAMANLLSRETSVQQASGAAASTISYDANPSDIKSGLTGNFTGTIGEGQAKEALALKKAAEAVGKASGQLVVLWVPAVGLDSRKDETEKKEISTALENLKTAIAAKGGTLIIRQAAESNDTLLSGDDVKAIPMEDFSSTMKATLDAILTDHIANFSVDLPMVPGLAAGLCDPFSSIGTASVDGNTLKVSAGKLYDHQQLTVSVTVNLKTEENGKPYFTEDQVTVLRSVKAGGTHHTGIYDTEQNGTLPVFPEAKADRIPSRITFVNSPNGPGSFQSPADLVALPGQLQFLPDASDQNTPDATFGRWVSGETYYSPGDAVVMPQGGMTMTAQWGHVELQLRLGDATAPAKKGNQMGSMRISNWGTYLTDKEPLGKNIQRIFFVDQAVEYTFDTSDRVGSSVTITRADGIEDLSTIDKAIYVGADSKKDAVVAYRLKDSNNVYIAGPGGVKAPADSSYMFYQMHSLKSVDFSGFYAETATQMDLMFCMCSGLNDITWGDHFNTSNVTNMGSMFKGCYGLKALDLSAFNTANVTNMSSMFGSCSGLTSLDLSGFDTANVTDMSSMFLSCFGLTSLDLTGFDTSSVGNMKSMFEGCSNLQDLDLSHFDTANVGVEEELVGVSSSRERQRGTMASMFKGCSNLKKLDLSGFDTSSVGDMASMFENCSKLTELDLTGKFSTANVGIAVKTPVYSSYTPTYGSMYKMFSGCSALPSLDLSNFNTSQVKNMGYMFSGCRNLASIDLSSFNTAPSTTANVTNMTKMFSSCQALQYGGSDLDSEKKAKGLELGQFNTSGATTMEGMFQNCSGLESLDLSCFNTGSSTTSNVETMTSMFSGCSGLTSLNLQDFKTTSVSSMSSMFSICKKLLNLDLSSFDTSNVTDMYGMFRECRSLQTLDLSTFNTSKVTNMSYMFFGFNDPIDPSKEKDDVNGIYPGGVAEDAVLRSLDLSHFDTSKVTTMLQMFEYSCLKEITLGGKFTTQNCSNIEQMFRACRELVTLNLGDSFYLPDQDFTSYRTPFNGCTRLEAVEGIRLDGAKTREDGYKKLKLNGMFYGLTALKKVVFVTPEDGVKMNLSSLDSMFYNCPSLEEVDLGNWILPNLSTVKEMFRIPNAAGAHLSPQLTINISWKGMSVESAAMTTTRIAYERTGQPVTLIVGTDYDPDAVETDPHSQQMKRIIDAFKSNVGEENVTVIPEAGGSFRTPARRQEIPYTVETWLEDQTEAETATVMFPMTGIEMDENGAGTTVYTIPSVDGYVFDQALCGSEDPFESLAVEETGDGMTVTLPISSVAEENVLRLYYKAVVDDLPKTAEYTVETWLDRDMTSTISQGTVVDGKVTYLVPSAEDGYRFDHSDPAAEAAAGGWTVTLPISEIPEENVISVYYVSDVEETPTEAEYTVETCLGGDMTSRTWTGTVVDGTVTYVIPAAEDGYRFDYSDPAAEAAAGGWTVTLPISEIPEENVIRVYYVSDVEETPAEAEYTVKYLCGGAVLDEVTREALPGTWVDETTDGIVEVFEGYDYESIESAAIAADGTTIILVYYTQRQMPGGEDDNGGDVGPEIIQDNGNSSGSDTDPVLAGAPDTQSEQLLSLSRSVVSYSAKDESGNIHYTSEELMPEENYGMPIPTAKYPLPVGSTVNYIVRVKYVGDSGALSGTINVNYPLPKSVSWVSGTEIKVSGAKNIADDTDYSGNVSPAKPQDFSVSGNVLTGTVKNLPATTYIDVQITCKLDSLNMPATSDGYYYWDGTADARTDNEAVSSNILRLWWKDNTDPDNPEPPAPKDEVAVRYSFMGDVPEGAGLPSSKVQKVGEYVELPEKSAEGYTFLGWYRDGTGDKLEQYQLQSSDVTTGAHFVGKWEIVETQETTYIVHYDYGTGAPKGLQPIPDASVLANAAHKVVKVAADAVAYYTFTGWTLGDETYAGGEEITVKRDITLTGTWTAHKGTINFNANYDGAESIESKTVILGNPGNDKLPAATRNHHRFQGWATNMNATTPEYQENTPVSLLIGNGKPLNADGSAVTLYAVWEANDTDYTVKHLEQGAGENGSDKVLAPPETFTGKFGTEVTAQAKTITGYKALEPSKKLVLKASGNEIIFYYEKTDYTLKVNTVLDDADNTPLRIGTEGISSRDYTVEAEKIWTVQVNGTDDQISANGTTYTYPKKVTAGEGENAKHYAFDEVLTTSNLTGSDTATVTLVYSLDEKGSGNNPDKPIPDGTPDKYQAFVTFKIGLNKDNVPTGYWGTTGTDAAPKMVVVPLYKDGDQTKGYDEKGTGHLTADQIPTAGTANTTNGYTGSGKWTVSEPSIEADITADTTYTLTWDLSSVSYTVVAHYRSAQKNTDGSFVENGSKTLSDKDASAEYGSTTLGELVLPTYTTGDNLTYDGKAYIFDSTATTYKLNNLAANATDKLTATAQIDLYFDVDNWSEKPEGNKPPEGTSDGEADKNQVLVKFVVASGDGVTGTGTVAPTSKVYTLDDTVTGGSAITGVTVTAGDKSAFAYWTYPDEATRTYNANALKLPENVTGGSEYTYTATFLKDEKGGTDPANPGDGIPDEYEAFVKFEIARDAENKENGTLEGEPFTRTYDLRQKNGDSYKITAGGSLDLKTSIEIGDYLGKTTSDGKVTAKANTNFAFSAWKMGETVVQAAAIKDGKADSSKATLAGTNVLTVTAGGEYTYTAHFAADTKGGPDTPDAGGDGIPDEYQVKVTYKAATGGKVTVDGKDATPAKGETAEKAIVLYLSVVDSDKVTLTKNGTVTFPEAIAAADSTYKFTKWTKQVGAEAAADDGTDATRKTETVQNVTGGTEYKFAAHFAKNVYTVTYAWYVDEGVTPPAGYPAGDGNGNAFVTAGEKISKPGDPTEAGYKFLGWYTKDTDGKLNTNPYDFETAVNADLTLYAYLDFLPQLTNVTKTADKTTSGVKTGEKITYTVTITPDASAGKLASFTVEDTVTGKTANNATVTKKLVFSGTAAEGQIAASHVRVTGTTGNWKDGTTFEVSGTTTSNAITLTYELPVDAFKACDTISNHIVVTPNSVKGNSGTEKGSEPDPVVTYTKQITGVTKVLDNGQLPMVIEANASSVTLNYTITVTGEQGAKFTIAEDSGAAITYPTGWTATKEYIMNDSGTMTFKATKTFEVKAGKVTEALSNTVKVEAKPGTDIPNDKKEVTETAYQVSYTFKDNVMPTGAELPKTQIVKAGTTGITVDTSYATATKLNGYQFSGWTTSDAQVQDNKFTMPEKDVTLTGEWTKLTPEIKSVEKAITAINGSDSVKESDGTTYKTVTKGNTITYKVTITPKENVGLVKSFKINDTLVNNLSSATVSIKNSNKTGADPGSWNTDGTIYTLNTATADPIEVTYTYTVAEITGTSTDKKVSNTATVTVWNGEANESPAPPENGQQKDSNTVDVPYGDPGLTVTKVVTKIGETTITKGEIGDTKVKPGETIEWTITVTNSGKIELKNIVVTDQLTVPAGLTGKTVTWGTMPDGATLNSEQTAATIASLAAGTSKEFTVSYKLDENYKPAKDEKIVNGAAAKAADNTEGKTPDDEKHEVIVARPAVTVNKTVDKTGSASVGDELKYTITVTNTGNMVLTDLKITDSFNGTKGEDGADIRSSATYKIGGSAGEDVGSFANGTFTISSLAVGATLTIEYTYTVAEADAGSKLTNTIAVVAGDDKVQDDTKTPDKPDPSVPDEKDPHKTETTVNYRITKIEKALVTKTDAETAKIDTNGITFPTEKNGQQEVTIPAGESVTLLYKITVTGDKGADYVVTDTGAKKTGGEGTQSGDTISGTIGDEPAVIYVTKTFGTGAGETALTGGMARNEASVAPRTPVEGKAPTDAPKKDEDKKASAPDVTVNQTYTLTVKAVDDKGNALNIFGSKNTETYENLPNGQDWTVVVNEEGEATTQYTYAFQKQVEVDSKHYAFDKFDEDASRSYQKTGNSTAITLIYAADEDPNDPTKPGDGEPDKYQAKVTFVIEHGVWDDDTTDGSAIITKVVTLRDENGDLSENGSYTLTEKDIPSKLRDDIGYENGSWKDIETPAGQEIDKNGAQYTFICSAIEYTITYTLNGGTVAGTNLTSYTIETETFTLVNPTRKGYVFSGWTGTSLTGATGTVTIAKGTTGNRVYTANWTLVPIDEPDFPFTPTPVSPTPTNPTPVTPTPTPGGTTITDENVPLAGAVGLNDTDHFAYIAGYEDNTVRPTRNISRAEVATIFFRLMTEEFRAAHWATENDLKDALAGDWYNNAVSTCANAGIITGYADGTFQPQKDITRAEFAVIAARFLGPDADDEGVGDFSDTANHWAAAEIRKAAKAGWITGNSNKFRPNDPITRAEVMVIVNRMLDRTPDAGHMLPDMKTWIDNPEGTWYYEAVQEATNGHDYERDELNVETWTAIQNEKNWKAIEMEWAANNGASAPKDDAQPVESDGETK